jgi:hypothetical protein
MEKAQQINNEEDKRNRFENFGPKPVFDCLFCCQEHFVFTKKIEIVLSQKYSGDDNSVNTLDRTYVIIGLEDLINKKYV